MDKNKLSEAMNNIDDKYIEKAVNYQPTRKRNIRFVCTAAAACLCLAAVGGAMLHGSVTVPQVKNEVTDSADTSAETPTSAQTKPQNTPVTTAPEAPTENSGSETQVSHEGPLKYSELVKHENTFTADLGGSAAGSIAMADIAAFEESDLQNGAAIIEGTITNMYIKKYNYTTPFDKFEEDSVMYYNDIPSLVYEITVEKSWYGGFNVGDTVVIEDEIFYIEGGSYQYLQPGGKYVIPLYNCGSEIWHPDTVLSGDVTRESELSTLYQYQPQIEAVDGGYIVPATWVTIVSDDCESVFMDGITNENPYFCDKMFFVPEDVFADRMNTLIDAAIE